MTTVPPLDETSSRHKIPQPELKNLLQEAADSRGRIPETSQSVLVKFTVSGDDPTQVVAETKRNFGSLPAEFQVTIEHAYLSVSDSVLFILRMSWSTYAMLSSVLDFHYICAVDGPSLLRKDSDLSNAEAASASMENVCPSESKE